MENKMRSLLKMIFSHLEKRDDNFFWNSFTEDVTWVVEGKHPIAGKYRSLREFRTDVFDRLEQTLTKPLKFKVKDVIVDGSRGVIILESDSITKKGVPYHARSCWVVNVAPNDKIDRVDSFPDSQMLADTFLNSKN